MRCPPRSSRSWPIEASACSSTSPASSVKISAISGSKSGVSATSALRYGQVAETLCAIIKDTGASQVVIGRTGHSELASRLFGSVAGTLAQASPVPVTIVP